MQELPAGTENVQANVAARDVQNQLIRTIVSLIATGVFIVASTPAGATEPTSESKVAATVTGPDTRSDRSNPRTG